MCVFALVAFDGGATTFITGVQLMGASTCASFLCYVTMHDLSHVCGVFTYPCMYMYIGVYSHIYIYILHIHAYTYSYTCLISCIGILHLSQITVVRQLDYKCS